MSKMRNCLLLPASILKNVVADNHPQPPKELPGDFRSLWRRVRSVLAGGAAVGEPLLRGGIGCRGVLGTALPLSPYDMGHRGAWEALWEDGHDRSAQGRRSSPTAARGTSVYPNALACLAIVVTLRARYWLA